MEDIEEQLAVRASWLYFMEGMTQADVAQELGTTRLKINRILADARRNGLVQIAINSPLTNSVQLEQELVREFGLKGASIIPSPLDASQVHNMIGKAAAAYLAHYLELNEIQGLGIGWGGTLREMVAQMPIATYSNMTVNSVMGGLTHGIEINTFNIVSELARKLRAKCQYLAAPIYAGSEQSRDIILAQDVFQNTFKLIEANDLVVVSIGDATEQSMLVRHGLPPDTTLNELVQSGAVCDVCGHYLNADGKPIDHPINRRAITLSMGALRRIPTLVFASGGLHKAAAIAAILRSGLGGVIISDEDTVRAAVEIARR
jgi:DNA-binding transcriptional regulator LsrR (DeoR family)